MLRSTDLVVMVHGLSCPKARDLPRSGVEPLSLALAGRFFTTEPSGMEALFLEV